MADAFVPPLRVCAHPRTLGRRGALEQPEIRRPERAELLQRAGQIAVTVAETVRPEILIITLQNRPLVREDHPVAEGPDQLGVGQVLDHLEHGPLAGEPGVATCRGATPATAWRTAAGVVRSTSKGSRSPSAPRIAAV